MSQTNLDSIMLDFQKEVQKYMADHPRPDLADMFDISTFSNTARNYLEKFGPIQAKKFIELYQKGVELQKEQSEFLKKSEKMGLGERRLAQIRILDKQLVLAKDIHTHTTIQTQKLESKMHMMNDNRPISNVLSNPDMVNILKILPSDISSIKPENYSPILLKLFSVQDYLVDMFKIPDILASLRENQENASKSWNKGLKKESDEEYTIEKVFQNFVPKISFTNSPESYMESYVAKMNAMYQIEDAYMRKEIGPLEYLYRNMAEIKNIEDPMLKTSISQIFSPTEPLVPPLQSHSPVVIAKTEEFRTIITASGMFAEENYPQEED